MKQTYMMFGIEPGGKRKYYLRQARYYELGDEVSSFVSSRFTPENKCQLLDVGAGTGVSHRYISHFIENDTSVIDYYAIEHPEHDINELFQPEDWKITHRDLNEGIPEDAFPEESFDVIVCEQVLEHLRYPQTILKDMYRLLKPDGIMIIGVPNFTTIPCWIRRHVVPKTDKLFKVKKVRGHIQAWTKRAFLRDVRNSCPGIKIEKVRGFRIISGGLLAFLENYRWYWQMNRFIGRMLPSFCTEIQIVCHK